MNNSALPHPARIITADQSTQASFPVLLRSHQKVLKKYATLSDFKYIKPFVASNTNLWTTQSSGVVGNHNHRPKSLNLSADNYLNNHGHFRASNNNLSAFDNNAMRPKLSSMVSTSSSTETNTNIHNTKHKITANNLSPRQYLPDYPVSYAGSEISYNDRHQSGEGLLYSGHFRAVHHSKWKVGIEPAENHSSQKSICSCSEHHIKNLKHTNTPEGLSWRRMHMSRAKLKATATTSELLSGFAMVAMVELQINEPTTVPEWLFVLFAVCTTILVAVHIFALMISTYILPNIDAISKLDVCELVKESPHERMRGFIELAWAFSTVLGLFLFLVEIAILCWVKFWDYSFMAAIAATIIVIPVLIMFVAFAVHFYHSLVVYKCDSSDDDIQQLEDMKKELDLADRKSVV